MNLLANNHTRRAALSSVLVGALLLVGLASPAAAAVPSTAAAASAPPAATPSPADPAEVSEPSPGPDDGEAGPHSADDPTGKALAITEPTVTGRTQVEGDVAQAATGVITGTVKGSTGQALPGVIVSVYSSTWNGVTAWDYPLAFVASVETNAAGAFRLSVATGYYTVFYNPVSDRDSAWSWVGGLAVPGKYPTLVGTAGWRADATLSVPHTIRGSLTGGPANTPLNAVPITLWACNQRTPDLLWCAPDWESTSGTGRYSFTQLPKGYYLVEVRSPDARYKGEWWTNKPDFLSSDPIFVTSGADASANINLGQFVQILPPLTLVGAAAVGRTLSLPAFTKVSGAKYQYIWYADSAAIAGSANKTSITVTSAHAGKQISARVKVSKSGYLTANRFTAKTTRVIANSAPTISGAPAVDRTLTAVPNAWTAGTTFTYQWYASGAAIAGATASTYTLTLAERDKKIQVGIKGSKPGYTTLFRGSLATAMVAQVAKPTISGTPKVGQRLTAKTSGWTPGTTFQYQWYASGVAISRATSSSLTVVSGYVGKSITVRVIGSKTGYLSFSKRSLPTSAVVK